MSSYYAWFTEGFNTRDLKEAKALLEELQALTRAAAVVRRFPLVSPRDRSA
jgi:hypothetical protein